MADEVLYEKFEFQEIERKDESFCLLIYDIVDNKRRTKFSSYMESYGIRVQKSAFEIRIGKKKMEEMLKGIPPYVSQEDSVKLYRIRGNEEVLCWGTAKKEISEQVIII